MGLQSAEVINDFVRVRLALLSYKQTKINFVCSGVYTLLLAVKACSAYANLVVSYMLNFKNRLAILSMNIYVSSKHRVTVSVNKVYKEFFTIGEVLRIPDSFISKSLMISLCRR